MVPNGLVRTLLITNANNWFICFDVWEYWFAIDHLIEGASGEQLISVLVKIFLLPLCPILLRQAVLQNSSGKKDAVGNTVVGLARLSAMVAELFSIVQV